MNKILHVTQFFHPDKGYQENSLALQQIKMGFDVTIICSDDLSLWSENIDQKNSILKKDEIFQNETGIKIIRLKKILKISGRIFAFKLRKNICAENPQILFLHGVYLPFTFIGLLSITKKSAKTLKVIIDDHMVFAGSYNKYSSVLYKIFNPFMRFAIRISNANISKLVAVSNETKKFMLRNYNFKKNIQVIPLGYNDELCYYDQSGAEEWRIQNNLSVNYRYILYIGKCDNYKNPIDLLLPFKKFLENNNNFALVIVGEMNYEYANIFNQKVNILDLTDSVFIKPPVKNADIRKVFSFADMAIWPHGSSMAMIEAMACNCPVIAPAIDVNLERLGDMRGFLFDDINEDLVIQMQNTIVHRNEIILNAKKWVIQYSWESLNKKFLENL